jgi:hypothetical protein
MPDAPVVAARPRRERRRLRGFAERLMAPGASPARPATRKGEAVRYMILVCVDEPVEVSPDLLECEDLDEAIEVASKHPGAKFGTIEVRPLWED